VRYITCRYDNQEQVGIELETGVCLPGLSNDSAAKDWPADMLQLIDRGPSFWADLIEWLPSLTDCVVPSTSVDYLAPIIRPRKNIICLGLNYKDHAEEAFKASGKSVKEQQHPVVFTKSVTSVNGPFGNIELDDRITSELDWEVELGVVIGVGGKHIAEENAYEHVFGYTVLNDVSARDVQFRHRQYFLGKSLDGACPMGPVIVAQQSLPDVHDLTISCSVNGETKQSNNTSNQTFNIAQTISILSGIMTLEPGDIIATGTPSGVGYARKPPEFLQVGDLLKSEIEKIGAIENKIVAAVQ